MPEPKTVRAANDNSSAGHSMPLLLPIIDLLALHVAMEHRAAANDNGVSDHSDETRS